MMSQRKLDMVGTYLTVRKRAKRTPDTIVQTTDSFLNIFNRIILSSQVGMGVEAHIEKFQNNFFLLLRTNLFKKKPKWSYTCHQFLQYSILKKQWLLVSKMNSEWKHPFHNIRCLCWSAEAQNFPFIFYYGREVKEYTHYYIVLNVGQAVSKRGI